MQDDLFKAGRAVTLRFARDARGRLPAREFLDSLHQGKRRNTKVPNLLAKMERLADNGPDSNEHHFKHLGDELYEFKAGNLRLACAWQEEGVLLLLLCGFVKKQQRTRPQDRQRALRILTEHRARPTHTGEEE
ncbi:MAG: type II toxin-antitoxin system RelE/ParE family toxin [Myxococcota bacterium]|nr:type II toxin-antitoxin system RelE/ParE family toxin [Myxococcota bacterium]